MKIDPRKGGLVLLACSLCALMTAVTGDIRALFATGTLIAAIAYPLGVTIYEDWNPMRWDI